MFLSSKYFYNNGRRIGEYKIEKIFNENGYVSFYPEQLTLKEQISYIKSASELVTTEGTSSHMSVFLPNNAKLIILKRQKEYNKNQVLIDKLKNYQTTYINVFFNFIKFKSMQSPCLLGITDELVLFFKKNMFNFTVSDIAVRDIIYYITACKNFNKNVVKILDEDISNNIEQLNIENFPHKEITVCNSFFKLIKIILYFNLYKSFHLCKKKFEKYFNASNKVFQYEKGKLVIKYNFYNKS